MRGWHFARWHPETSCIMSVIPPSAAADNAIVASSVKGTVTAAKRDAQATGRGRWRQGRKILHQ